MICLIIKSHDTEWLLRQVTLFPFMSVLTCWCWFPVPYKASSTIIFCLRKASGENPKLILATSIPTLPFSRGSGGQQCEGLFWRDDYIIFVTAMAKKPQYEVFVKIPLQSQCSRDHTHFWPHFNLEFNFAHALAYFSSNMQKGLLKNACTEKSNYKNCSHSPL